MLDILAVLDEPLGPPTVRAPIHIQWDAAFGQRMKKANDLVKSDPDACFDYCTQLLENPHPCFARVLIFLLVARCETEDLPQAWVYIEMARRAWKHLPEDYDSSLPDFQAMQLYLGEQIISSSMELRMLRVIGVSKEFKDGPLRPCPTCGHNEVHSEDRDKDKDKKTGNAKDEHKDKTGIKDEVEDKKPSIKKVQAGATGSGTPTNSRVQRVPAVTSRRVKKEAAYSAGKQAAAIPVRLKINRK